MIQEPIIREAVAADAALIADLSRQTFYDTFAKENSMEDMDRFMNEQFTRAALMQEVGAAGHHFLLAFVGEEVAGYAKLREDNKQLPESMEIARLYAASQWIGKGIGRALMNACLQKALYLQKQNVWLGVWEKNTRAIQFYESFGFEKFGEHDFILGSDVQRDWLMKKRLA